MSRRFFLISSALLLTLGLSISCKSDPSSEPEPSSGGETIITDDGDLGTLVYLTDSTEWRVKVFKEHLLYSEAASITLPAPWSIPTREQASILRTLTYGSGSERFVTSDGYTFGMPSSSVSKAGTKTKYSVLGLHIRRTIIIVNF